MIPESITTDSWTPPRTDEPPYAEAYAEMAFYTGVSDQRMAEFSSTNEFEQLARVSTSVPPGMFPDPPAFWLGRSKSSYAQYSAYQHFGPLAGLNCLQIGGHGQHAIEMLLGGAESATLVSPVLGELHFGLRMAEEAQVADRFQVICSVAEHLPFFVGSVDRILSVASMHHTVTTLSYPEIGRCLNADGKFATIDVWRGSLYELGIRLFGKAERSVHCRPIDTDRLQPALDTFQDVEVQTIGFGFRYLEALLDRIGYLPPVSLSLKAAKLESRLAAIVPGSGRLASLVLVLGSGSDVK